MLFTEPSFLFLFLPVLLLIYFAVPSAVRNLILLGASLFFYAWGEAVFVLVMLSSIAVNYASGVAIGLARGPRAARALLAVGLAANLGLLVFFKYANFIVENLRPVTGWLDLAPITLDPVHLPIGISFFTFQGISYIIDVYRREVEAQRNPLDLALFISLFPQLIAGPIVRYTDVAAAIARRTVTQEGFAYGVRRFITGLGKKMLIANTVAWPADQIFSLPGDELTFTVAWFGAICYTLQIYFDFSGYSDMAIGLGYMLGFSFPENFRYPYISRSITEFWRRWHITLSSWFRDYLYIPLGGNRVGRLRLYANLLTVFVLCGIWHGASWTFLVWGGFHGVFLVAERLVGLDRIARLWAPVRHAYLLLAVVASWVLFRADTLGDAISFWGAMVGLGQGDAARYGVQLYLDNQLLMTLVVAAVAATPALPYLVSQVEELHTRIRRPAFELGSRVLAFCGLVMVLALSVIWAAASTYNPFIYFRF